MRGPHYLRAITNDMHVAELHAATHVILTSAPVETANKNTEAPRICSVAAFPALTLSSPLSSIKESQALFSVHGYLGSDENSGERQRKSRTRRVFFFLNFGLPDSCLVLFRDGGTCCSPRERLAEIQQPGPSPCRRVSSLSISLSVFLSLALSPAWLIWGFFNFCRCIPYILELDNPSPRKEEIVRAVKLLIISSQKGHDIMFPKVRSQALNLEIGNP